MRNEQAQARRQFASTQLGRMSMQFAPDFPGMVTVLAEMISAVEDKRLALEQAIGEPLFEQGLAALRREHQIAIFEAGRKQPEAAVRRAFAAMLARLSAEVGLLAVTFKNLEAAQARAGGMH